MIQKLIKYFIPQPYTHNEEEHRKAKITVGTFLLVAYFNINYIVISVIFEYMGGLYSQVPLLITSIVCLFVFKEKNIPRQATNFIFFTICIISIATTVYFTKGYQSFILPWIASTPIVALLISGKRGGLISLIACSIVMILFYYFYSNGYEFPEGYNLKYKNIFSFTTNIGLIFILYGIAIVFENTKNTALKNLDIKNRQLDEQKQKVEAKQKEILDSINYAKKIQESILPSDKQIKQFLPDSFVLYKPKDIVSGDFYWVTKWGNKVLFATVDCTGHGVPGAFMSIVGQNLLNQTINEYGITQPNLVLNMLNKGIAKTLNQHADNEELRDGMDISLCSLDTQTMHIEFAGAYSPLWVLRNGELIEIKGDKFPIGSFVDDTVQYFQNNEMQLQQNDIVYIFTDGYPDQFGGPKRKKFGYKKLKNLLREMAHTPLENQKEILNTTIENWKAECDEQQIDDILILGVKI
jgi:serine phosphatase RsbU (regulator of sigma subunit)